jgi:hypothetical protein
MLVSPPNFKVVAAVDSVITSAVLVVCYLTSSTITIVVIV